MPWEPLPGAKKTARPVSESLDRLLRGLGGSDGAPLRAVHGAWPELVGERVAAHAVPVLVRRGRLQVTIDDPAWATQVRFLEGDLLRRFDELLGVGVIQGIDVSVRRPGVDRPGPDPRAGGTGSTSRRPLH